MTIPKTREEKQPSSEFFISHGAWVYEKKIFDKKGKTVLHGMEFLSVKIPQERYMTTLSPDKWETLSLEEKGKWIDVVVKINNW